MMFLLCASWHDWVPESIKQYIPGIYQNERSNTIQNKNIRGLQSTGVLNLKESAFKKIDHNGPLNIERAAIETIDVNGAVDMKQSSAENMKVIGQLTIQNSAVATLNIVGSLVADNAVIKDLQVTSNSVDLKDSKIANIRVLKTPGLVTINIQGNTMISEIHVDKDNKNPQIKVSEGSKIAKIVFESGDGNVINSGTIAEIVGSVNKGSQNN